MSANDRKIRADQIDRAVSLAATRIAVAIDRMAAELPEDTAFPMVIEELVGELTEPDPRQRPKVSWFMDLIMENVNVREAYAAAVARRPATARVKQ